MDYWLEYSANGMTSAFCLPGNGYFDPGVASVYDGPCIMREERERRPCIWPLATWRQRYAMGDQLHSRNSTETRFWADLESIETLLDSRRSKDLAGIL